MRFRSILCVLFLCLTCAANGYGRSYLAADSSRYKIVSLDSLSDEDLALLEEYQDSFLREVEDIKAAISFSKKNRKSIDTTIAQLNRSSHAEIALDVCGPVLSNGRYSGLKGAAIYPSAMYYHKWGLYAALSMGFFTDSTIRHRAKVPLVVVSPGFSRTFFKRWSVSVGYSRSFIFYVNDIQKGMLNNNVTFSTGFDFWSYLSLNISAGVSWSSNLKSKKYTTIFLKKVYYSTITRDAGQAYSTNLTLTLKKDFCFFNVLGAKALTISPELYFLFGHDNNTLITRSINSHPSLPGTNTGPAGILSYDKFFGFLDIEPGLTIDWRIKNVEIFASFHCAIPFNEYDSDKAVRVANPKEYYPYGQGGIKYLFRIQKKLKPRA